MTVKKFFIAALLSLSTLGAASAQQFAAPQFAPPVVAPPVSVSPQFNAPQFNPPVAPLAPQFTQIQGNPAVTNPPAANGQPVFQVPISRVQPSINS